MTQGSCAPVTSLAHTMAAVHAGVCSTPSARDPGGSYRVMWFHLHVGPTAVVKLFVDPKQNKKWLHGVRAIQHHFVIIPSLLPYPPAFCSPPCSSYRSRLPSPWPQLPLSFLCPPPRSAPSVRVECESWVCLADRSGVPHLMEKWAVHTRRSQWCPRALQRDLRKVVWTWDFLRPCLGGRGGWVEKFCWYR